MPFLPAHGGDFGFEGCGDLLCAHGAGAQDARPGGACEVEHGGLDPDRAVAAIEDVRDARTEALAHMFRGRRADVGERIGARCGERHAGQLEQPSRERMRRRAQRHGRTTGGHDAGHAGLLGQHERERTGPESADELARRIVEFRQFLRVRQVEHMDDERVVRRPALGPEDGAAGLGIQRVRGEPINRLGRDGHQTAVAQHPGEPAQGGGGGAVETGFHAGQ